MKIDDEARKAALFELDRNDLRSPIRASSLVLVQCIVARDDRRSAKAKSEQLRNEFLGDRLPQFATCRRYALDVPTFLECA